jgi:hypothetical protein
MDLLKYRAVALWHTLTLGTKEECTYSPTLNIELFSRYKGEIEIGFTRYKWIKQKWETNFWKF